MGGQNHQPTNRNLTAASAWLSQRVGEGFALVLQANNHLEDAIIIGMGRQYVENLTASLKGTAEHHVRLAVEALVRSEAVLSEIQVGFRRLREAAFVEGYTGNPLAPQLRTLKLATALDGVLVQPYIHSRVWDELEERIEKQNVLATLAWEAEQFALLTEPTRRLVNTLSACQRIAETEGGLSMANAIENNEVPLRQHYAQVFSLWNTNHAMFLYSALIMTELFYRASAFPSLLESDPANIGTRAA